jgi:Ca2+ transporting ATPase
LAILKYFAKIGAKYDDYRNRYEIKVKFPFSSSRKRMSVVLNYKENAHLFIKGASEMVLASCNSWYNNQSGQVEPIAPEMNQKLN